MWTAFLDQEVKNMAQNSTLELWVADFIEFFI